MTTTAGEPRPSTTREPVRHQHVPGLGDASRLGYAHIVQAGDYYFLAGQMGLDEDYQVIADGFDTQVRRTLQSVTAALEAVGLSAHDLVSMTVYLTDMRTSGRFFELRTEVFGDLPLASTTVEVSQLPLPGLRIEVQAIAWSPASA